MHVPINRASKYQKQTSKKMPKLEMDKSTTELRDLNLSLSITEKYLNRKLSNNEEYFNNIINRFDLDIYKTNYCRVHILFKYLCNFYQIRSCARPQNISLNVEYRNRLTLYGQQIFYKGVCKSIEEDNSMGKRVLFNN